MTIKQALDYISVSQAHHTWIVWDIQTGEIVQVNQYDHVPTPTDEIERAMALQDDQIGVFLESAGIDDKLLERLAHDLVRFGPRDTVLFAWSRSTVSELVAMLILDRYRDPMTKRDARLIVDHLWQLHRDDLTLPVRNAFYESIRKGYWDTAALRKARIYLAALEYDEKRLKAIWTGVIQGQVTWSERFALMEAFAYVQTSDHDIVSDMLQAFSMDVPFSAKFETMMNLGRIGETSGDESAEAIRRCIYDSSDVIVAFREQVVRRVTSSSYDWVMCGCCCYGRVHHASSFHAQLCSECLGIGFVSIP